MEGSPVRRPDRSRSAGLKEAQDIRIFQAELVCLLAAELPDVEIFFGRVDNSKGPSLPPWVRSYLDRHPSLHDKLQKGELVGISHKESNSELQLVGAKRSNILLIPLINESVLYGAIGLVSRPDGPHVFSQDGLETARQLVHDAGPVLARLDEIETLRRDNRELSARVERLAEAEKKLAEVTEKQNALKAILEMRSHLQANVAHELRTPLALVRGYARMILDGRAGDINQTQRDFLTVITDNSNRLIHLVNWMSHIVDINVQHFHLSVFDLRDLWAECRKAYEAVLEEKHIKLVEQIPEQRFTLIADREKLALVFNGLLALALRLIKPGGAIRVEFLHGRERETTVKISQNGDAIPSETLAAISAHPANAVSGRVPQSQNSGEFELSGIHDVIGMHGGRIFVNSKAGEGSTVLFTLPAVIPDGEENFNHEQAVHTGRRRR